MPTPSSVLLNSSYYSSKLHGNQPSIPKPVSMKSSRHGGGRSRSTSPTSSSSSSYSNYSARKPPRIEISTPSAGTDRIKRFSNVDGDEDLALDQKINAYLSRPAIGKFKAASVGRDVSTVVKHSAATRTKLDFSTGSTPTTPRKSTGSRYLDSSWEKTEKPPARYSVSPAPATKPVVVSTDTRSRDLSPPSNSNPLSRKIAEFLNRTDHISEEWKKLGTKKQKKEATSGRKSDLSSARSRDETVSRCSSRLSNRDDESDEVRPVSRLSNVTNDETPQQSNAIERDAKLSRVEAKTDLKDETKLDSRQSDLDTEPRQESKHSAPETRVSFVNP